MLMQDSVKSLMEDNFLMSFIYSVSNVWIKILFHWRRVELCSCRIQSFPRQSIGDDGSCKFNIVDGNTITEVSKTNINPEANELM